MQRGNAQNANSDVNEDDPMYEVGEKRKPFFSPYDIPLILYYTVLDSKPTGQRGCDIGSGYPGQGRMNERGPRDADA